MNPDLARALDAYQAFLVALEDALGGDGILPRAALDRLEAAHRALRSADRLAFWATVRAIGDAGST